MDPIAAQAQSLLTIQQALQVRPATSVEAPALLALLGQELELVLQARLPESVQLRLPSGQVLTAQGHLPYPEGTLLRAQASQPSPGEAGLRLQVKEAIPPAPPAILAPLLQGEAAPLAARLAQEPPAAQLLPLVRLLSALSDAALPDADQIQQAMAQLPAALLDGLGQALDPTGTASSRELARLLLNVLASPNVADAPVSGDFLEQALGRFEGAIARRPDLPVHDRDALTAWVRNLLQQTADAARVPSARSPLVPPKLAAALQAHTGPKADLPESWEAWIRGTVSTLSDPAASPREAPFHALQAREGTAFFEIPLPWQQAGSLQLWVESDAPEARHQGEAPTQRVLLGMTFSRLGETRLGLAQGAATLQVRIWTEHPELLQEEQAGIQDELAGLGRAVDLRIYALAPPADGPIPTIRSLVTGPSLSALG